MTDRGSYILKVEIDIEVMLNDLSARSFRLSSEKVGSAQKPRYARRKSAREDNGNIAKCNVLLLDDTSGVFLTR